MKTFDFTNVADKFENHIKGQPLWYDLFVTNFLPEFLSFFIRNNSTVYDLGAFTGNIEMQLNDIISNRNINFIPIEKNDSMIFNYKGNKDRIVKKDILSIKYKKFSLCTSILTLSFLHPSKRKYLLRELKNKVEIGGAIIILEKFQNKSGIVGTIFNRITWKNKLNNKEPLEDIINKELALSGSRYPLLKKEIKGFKLIWAYGDFKSYIYIKR